MYKIHSIVKRGYLHKDFCEDFSLICSINERFLFIGVFDGCSSGADSHFASTLLAKIFKKECNSITTTDGKTCKELLKQLIEKVAHKLIDTQKMIGLIDIELLATMVTTVIDRKENKAEIVVAGDGFVNINGKKHEIDEDNKPEYIAYHLNRINNTDNYFEHWFDTYTHKYSVDEIKDLTISTDGILSFKEEFKQDDDKTINPITYLSEDLFLINNSTMLSRKCNILQKKHKLTNFDDLGIIRIIKI